MPFKAFDFSLLHTYPIKERRNLVTQESMVSPDQAPPPFKNHDLDKVVEAIVAARCAQKQVVMMLGAHVIKSGLSPLVSDMLDRGYITHLATNGAGAVHDFELALIGETSEDVADSIETGMFGMAEETGALINRAVQIGAGDGLGYGESLGRFIAEDEGFGFRRLSVLYHAYRLGIPLTVHIGIGTDIHHQHPTVDFGALGWASGQDFRVYCQTISELEDGVFLNFGSAVTGPEVFLKALSMARNTGHAVFHITTANFDLIPLGDYRTPVGKDDPYYYYRPRKNIINRPTSSGGQGYHIEGDHSVTVPNLYHRLRTALGDTVTPTSQRKPPDSSAAVSNRSMGAAKSLAELFTRHPDLSELREPLARAYTAIANSIERGGTLFIGGNGGSMSDALHIAGELLKSYKRPRPIPKRQHQRLATQPDGDLLIRHLEGGLRTIVLGANAALSSAVENDNEERGLALAQELYACARPGDVLLGISTSGNARNIVYATQVANALGLTTIAMTGVGGGEIANLADIALRAPAQETDRVQEQHVLLYHCLCEMLERDFFTEGEGL